MSSPLLTTKLYTPPLRPGLVLRPRLIERLNAGVCRKLTLISAPAGFGKTTLVAEWTRSAGVYHHSEPDEECDAPLQIAWLSLSEGDNDPVLFLRYLLAALQQLDETIGQGAQILLQSPQMPSWQGLVIQLLNDISAFPDPFLLVLDDYQAIHRSEIHEMLGFLIDNQPSQMHTVITTRRDPRLPLARWRARGESTEVRTPDLRFTVEEARAFLNDRMGLDLTAELVEALEARTEGWITGLQLAALALQGTASLRGSHDPAEFVRQFSGSDRYVIDYLVDEVLQRQPAHVRRFLQQTAVLKELAAPLCDYVRFGEAEPPSSSVATAVRFSEAEPPSSSDRTDLQFGKAQTSAGKVDSAAILQEIEQANLFLIPLDNRREWYRYHHLFADVLLTAADEEETQASHRRAASWYEIHGRPDNAIRHALAGTDLGTAVRVIKTAAPDQLQHGGFVRLLSWLDGLPEEVVCSDAELATYKGYVLLWTGESEAAASFAAAAEGSLPEGAPDAARGRFLTLRAHLCAERGLEVIPFATEAIELMDESTPFFYGAALLLLALGYKASGNVSEMMEIFSQLARLEQQRNPFMAAVAIAEMADVLRLQGKRREALVLCQGAMELQTDSRGRPLPSLITVLLIAALLAHEVNDLTLALQRAEQSATMAQQTGMFFLAAQSKCYVDVPCRWALGERTAAWAALQQARELTAGDHPLYPEAKLDVGSYEAWLHLKEGNIPAAARWAATFDFPPGNFHYDQSHVYLTFVRVLLAQDRVQEAVETLQQLETWACAGGWERVLLSSALLCAVVAQKSGDEASALDCLAQALHAAADGDYRRAFLDEDPVICELLPLLRTRQDETIDLAFVDRLLDDFDETQNERRGMAEDGDKATHPLSLVAQPLVDPLSERELEVLELLAKGLSTPNIALKLYISAGTAKWHTINIYRKLDVHSRIQAVSRARELGLI